MTPADELRQAAETLRERAAKATPGPWKYDERFGYIDSNGDGNRVVQYRGIETGDGDWIATLSPAVAEPLAALLEAIDNDQFYATVDNAQELARQINEETK